MIHSPGVPPRPLLPLPLPLPRPPPQVFKAAVKRLHASGSS